MRRTASVILFILGGWLLASGIMIAGFDFGVGTEMMLLVAAVMAGLASPFLLVGTYASPGNRLSDLGMTLMISAAAGGGVAVTMWSVVSDPKFKQLMPPNPQLPDFRFAVIPAATAVMIVAAIGFSLWWFARSREQRAEGDLERAFGDE